MRSSLVLCVLLGVILSVRAATLAPSVEPSTSTGYYGTTTTTTSTVPNTSSPPVTTAPTSPLTTSSNSPSPSQIMCHSGWEVFEGRCYYFVNEGMTWSQAQSNCALLDSMLVSVRSPQEYGFLQQLTLNNENSEAWLGGFYLQDQWLWLDGSWFYNTTFSFNEYPDSSNPCLTLIYDEAWSNSQCNEYSSSICVKNSNVPPMMLCPEGWTGFLGRCYLFNFEPLNWSQADTYCAGLEASLVSVHSPEEYSFLYQQSSLNEMSATWLGGFYFEDQWMWLDGSWFYPGFYSSMSPDSTSSCLSTFAPDGWSNYDCSQAFPSFCVKNAFS